jgi:hypothetical protein
MANRTDAGQTFNRSIVYCPVCSETVELFNDHLTPRSKDVRCGNCFYGFTVDQVKRLGELQDELMRHDAERRDLISKYL